ncbi:MAG: GGDEF domain-containing protein [Acidimicrobiia bacterium]
MPKFHDMQKKLAYLPIGLTLLFATFSATFAVAKMDTLTITFSILTCLSAIGSVLNTYYAQDDLQRKSTQTRNDNDTAFNNRRHTESISHAIDHKNIDFDATANTESATSSRAKPIDESTLDDDHRDDESGLLSNSFFPVYLEQRITAARRTLRPVSLVTFELDGLDKNDSHSPSDRNFYISAVGDVVKRTLRESDCAFRIDENTFAAVMDDTTESGAVWAAERVRGVLHTGALAGRVTVSAGVACYPSHALESASLIECSQKALEAAKARGVDQVEIAAEQ